MYKIDYMTNVGQHHMTVTHPHYQAIYNYLPDNINFNLCNYQSNINSSWHDYLIRIGTKAKELGATEKDIEFFISKIHPNCKYQEQSNLYFVPTHPYFGSEPHIINLEHWMSHYTYLVEQFVSIGKEVPIDDIGWQKVVLATMLEENFKYICSHMHDTIDTFKFLTRDYPELQNKFVYLPLASQEADKEIKHKSFDKPLKILFTNSFGGQLGNFRIRGGYEAYEAIKKVLHCDIHFTTIGPAPQFTHEKVVQYPHVDYETFQKLIDESHILLLPAMRVHTISLVKAMCNGIIPIVSDGWGFNEFIDNEYNGIIVDGHNGITTWKDKNNIFQEDGTKSANPIIIENIYNVLVSLINDINSVEILSNNCIEFAKRNFKLEHRNNILLEMIQNACA